LDRVVRVGSFSKTLSAAVRCGFVAARPDWIESLADLQLATEFGSPALSAELVLALLRDGSYRRHLELLRRRLAEAMAETARRLRAIGIEPWLMPKAGMFLWCRLPDGQDAAAIARRCLEQGVVLAPGNAFSATQSARSYLRFNVAQSGDPRLYPILARALEP
ncbi:MAG: aminotransferase class I/II-fold pyridoxal phosphate-dependent enzyme, partial [Dongiaceae bacterium]